MRDCICCEDLVGIEESRLDLIQQNRDLAVLYVKIMALPVTLFAGSIVFNYWIKRKFGPL
jgi:hypothetical protein